MNAIVQANPVNTSAETAPVEARRQDKANEAKQLSAAQLMHSQRATDPAQMMHAMMQVNGGGTCASSTMHQAQGHAAPKPTTDRSHLEAVAKPLPKDKPAPNAYHDTVMAKADDALAMLRNLPVNQKVHSNHSGAAAKGQGASTSSQTVGNTVQVTQIAGVSALSALGASQGAEPHDDKD